MKASRQISAKELGRALDEHIGMRPLEKYSESCRYRIWKMRQRIRETILEIEKKQVLTKSV